MNDNIISFYSLTGKGYENGWWTNCKCRYRLFKGARNTKKSFDMIGLEVLNKIMTDPRRNVLIIRQNCNTNRQSTFSTLVMLLNNLDTTNTYYIPLIKDFSISKTDMTITRKSTGQVILFRGMDDTQKIQSIRTVKGFLTDVYFEEAFEIEDYDAFRKIDGSLRLPKYAPSDLFIQITFCFNAWNNKTWLYDKFFKGRLEDDYNYLDDPSNSYQDYKNINEVPPLGYGKGIYLHTSTYKINEFRASDYDLSMDNLKEKALDIYKVEGLGMWGVSSGATYTHFSDDLILSDNQLQSLIKRNTRFAIGIDTGLSNGEGKIVYDKNMRYKSATTMILCGVSNYNSSLVMYDEYFHSNQGLKIPKTEPEIMEEIIQTLLAWKQKYWFLDTGQINCYVDCADIGFREGLSLKAREFGLYNVYFLSSTKLKIQARVDFINLIMAYKSFLISPTCSNLIREIKNSNKGENGEPREDFDDHTINASEYAWAPIIQDIKMRKTFKQRWEPCQRFFLYVNFAKSSYF